jgi:Tfp pilus assembly protein PilF
MNIRPSCPRIAPPNGRDLIDAWTRLAFTHREDGRLDDAEQAARAALRHGPDTAAARHVLGMVHHDRNRLAEAEDSFRGAIRLNPDAPGAWINLGLVRHKLGDLAEAEACYRVAARLGAPVWAVGGNLGLVLLEQGRVEEAETACRLALAERPDDPGPRLNLAMVLLLTGRLAEGWDAYEARLAVDPWTVPPPNSLAPPLTALSQAAGRTVLVRAEQGFGDTLQFCRYVTLLAEAGATVVLEAPAPLLRLLRGLPGVARVVAMDGDMPWFDTHCRLMSLPRLFGTTLRTVPNRSPYLRADPDLVAAWRARLAGLPPRRIGLVWAGGKRPDNPHAAAVDRRRSIPFHLLAPLAAVDGCAFVSLCVNADGAGEVGADEAGEMRVEGTREVSAAAARDLDAGHASTAEAGDSTFSDPKRADWLHDPTAAIGDFADTAAAMAALDLVIAVDTAAAHLAGALGRPVWLLNRYDTCWRWLRDRDDSPWYPTLRQFRQPAPGDWVSVIARVAAALRAA